MAGRSPGHDEPLVMLEITSSSQKVQHRPGIRRKRSSVAPGVTPILGASTSYRS